MFQSTHPRGVRPISIVCSHIIRICFNPRTHAGCDAAPRSMAACTPSVSIHAPTRGATYTRRSKIHQGRVSIHAPTRGATTRRRINQDGPLRFNPRTHAGCDAVAINIIKILKGVSIHAPTRGATERPASLRCIYQRFNPRTHAGCDTRQPQ